MKIEQPAQDTHDRKVRKIAKELEKQNWNVQADLPGYDIPEGIGKGGYVPDIVARKGSKTKIIEVDTPGTENVDQLSTFRRSAGQRDNAEFEHVITKPKT
jgi:hypothetical protein